ncbi:MAG: hypothetical protein WD669_05965 [Pirellulales bacterium]
MSPVRKLALAGLVLGVVALVGSPAHALVVNGNTTVTAAPPSDNPGWANTTISGSRNYIYLGNGWALTARHVGAPTGPGETLQFFNGTTTVAASMIPGQNYVVRNPATVVNTASQTVNLSTPSGGLETDLRLIRLSVDPGLPAVTIADQSPLAGGRVVFIGHGRSRASTPTNWDASTVPWGETSCSSGANCFQGYIANDPNDDTKRWGENNVANPGSYPGAGAFYQVLSPTTGVIKLTTPDTITRNAIALPTEYDFTGGLTHEAQAVDADSGSAMFYKRNGTQWELAGIVNSTLTFANQPAYTAVWNPSSGQGMVTVITDLSYYYNSNPLDDHAFSISDIIRTHPNFSAMGDVNLDGVVSGTGAGPAATDDVTAFIQGIDGPGGSFQGWGYNNGLGMATITSWKNGDIAHGVGVGTCAVALGGSLCAGGDGKTDVYDFLALRDAINNPLGMAALEEFFNSATGNPGGNVPEPTAAILALLAALFLCCGSRRRAGRM